jgi:hypothetical protein
MSPFLWPEPLAARSAFQFLASLVEFDQIMMDGPLRIRWAVFTGIPTNHWVGAFSTRECVQLCPTWARFSRTSGRVFD